MILRKPKPPTWNQIDSERSSVPPPLGDAEIRKILRPPSVLDKSLKALPILQVLGKYGPVSGGQLARIFHDGNLASISHNPMIGLIDEGYVTVEKTRAWRGTTNLFTITAKGRAALKGHKT